MFERTREEKDLDADRWVPVREYTLLHEAGVAQGILESAGIESLLDNEATVGILTHMSNAIGGVRIRVRPADLEAARALLSTAALEAPPAEGEASAGAQTLERDDDEPMETVVEAMVRRALVASFVGFFLPVVLHLRSLTLLARESRKSIRVRGERRARPRKAAQWRERGADLAHFGPSATYGSRRAEPGTHASKPRERTGRVPGGARERASVTRMA